MRCRPFRKEEVPRLLRQFDNAYEYRNKSILSLGICTGFRIGELMSLKVADVYHRGGVNDVLQVPKRFMKGNHPRPPKKIFPEAKYYLEEWYSELRDRYKATLRSHVFVSKKGGALEPDSVWRIINKAAKEAGINPQGVGTHSMRKTFSNTVYDYWVDRAREGARVEPMRMVQLELGHSNIEDTYRYMSFKMEEKPDNVFEDYFENFGLSKVEMG